MKCYGIDERLTHRVIGSPHRRRRCYAVEAFRIIPCHDGECSDITRSAVGRLQSESVCLLSMFCGNDVSWTSPDSSHLDFSLHSSFVVQGERAKLDFTIDQTGRLKTFKLPRWGNPEGAESHCVDFGGVVEEEGTFCGYTIPTRLRIGWHFGSDRC